MLEIKPGTQRCFLLQSHFETNSFIFCCFHVSSSCKSFSLIKIAYIFFSYYSFELFIVRIGLHFLLNGHGMQYHIYFTGYFDFIGSGSASARTFPSAKTVSFPSPLKLIFPHINICDTRCFPKNGDRTHTTAPHIPECCRVYSRISGRIWHYQ